MRNGELLHGHPDIPREVLADALDWALIGGNHLVGTVSGLIEGRWESFTREQVSKMFADKAITYEAYEAWTAWRCIMDASESIRSYERPFPETSDMRKPAELASSEIQEGK